MKKWIMSGACAAALALGGFALAAETKTVEGELLDTHCYSKGGAKGEDHAGCASKCLSTGIPAAVLVDGKAWTLTTNSVPLAEAGGKTVRVTGIQNEEAQTIVPEKIEVKDGENWKEIKMKDQHHK